MLSHCGSRDAIKWGVRNGIRRYKCRNCQSLFSARSICHALNHKRLTISNIQKNMCQTPVFKRRFSTQLFTKPLTINILENRNVPDMGKCILNTVREGHYQKPLSTQLIILFALNRATTKKIGQQVHQNSRIQNQVSKYRIWSESRTS